MSRKTDELTYLRRSVERIEDILDKLVPEPKPYKKEIPETEVSVVWVDKKNGLIMCNKCEGHGFHKGRYGDDITCNFCDGKKTVRLIDTSKELQCKPK